jgi:hypothetical protein
MAIQFFQYSGTMTGTKGVIDGVFEIGVTKT